MRDLVEERVGRDHVGAATEITVWGSVLAPHAAPSGT